MPTFHISKDWIKIKIQIIESGKFYWWNGSKIRADCSDCLRCSCSRSWGCNLNQFEHQTNGIFIDAKVLKCKNNGEQCRVKRKVSIFSITQINWMLNIVTYLNEMLKGKWAIFNFAKLFVVNIPKEPTNQAFVNFHSDPNLKKKDFDLEFSVWWW